MFVSSRNQVPYQEYVSNKMFALSNPPLPLHARTEEIVQSVLQTHPHTGILVWSARTDFNKRLTACVKCFNRTLMELCDATSFKGDGFGDVFVTKFSASSQTTSRLLLAMLEMVLGFVDELHKGRTKAATFYFRHLSHLGRTTDVVADMIPILDANGCLAEFIVLETPTNEDVAAAVVYSPDGVVPPTTRRFSLLHTWTWIDCTCDQTQQRHHHRVGNCFNDDWHCIECGTSATPTRRYSGCFFFPCTIFFHLKRLLSPLGRELTARKTCAMRVD